MSNMTTTPGFSPQQIADACREFGGQVAPLPEGIDGAQLLWAMAGNESSFGRNVIPRHESAFDVGGMYAGNPPMPSLLREFGSAAACSYGPWQLLFVNAPQGTRPKDMQDLATCAQASVAFLNSLLRRFRPQTLTGIGQCWNHGSPTSHPSAGVVAYCAQLATHYKVPLPGAAPIPTTPDPSSTSAVGPS